MIQSTQPKQAQFGTLKTPNVRSAESGAAPTKIVLMSRTPKQNDNSNAAKGQVAHGETPQTRNAPASKAGSVLTEAESAAKAQTASMGAFIDLEHAFRRAHNVPVLRTVLATGARRLVPYSTGVVFDRAMPASLKNLSGANAPRWTLTAIDGTTSVDRRAPFSIAFETLLGDLESAGDALLAKPLCIKLDANLVGEEVIAHLGADILALWVPALDTKQNVIGGFFGLRQKEWPVQEQTVLTSLMQAWSHAYCALTADKPSISRIALKLFAHREFGITAAALAILVLAWPVQFSVLAPAEIVGARPTLLSAPLDGIVSRIEVNPGEAVNSGEPVIMMLDTQLRSNLTVAEKNEDLAIAKYNREVQASAFSNRGNAEITLAAADLAVAQAELARAKEAFSRASITAPKAGIALFTSAADLIGKPVRTGDPLIEIVDPSITELKIDLAIADGIDMKPGTSAKLFLEGDPVNPLPVTISRIGYRPVHVDGAAMAYRLFADFDTANSGSLGARGTVRIEGAQVPLGFYLFRRPIASLRQKFGL